MRKKYIVDVNKTRLDKFLAEHAKVSRSHVQSDIVSGLVTVNGRKISEGSFVVRLGDEVSYTPGSRSVSSPAKDLLIKTLYESDDILILDKPAGISVHPGAGFKGDSVTQMLVFRYPKLAQVGQPDRPGIVHRLDKETSGCLLVAKTSDAYKYLLKVFADRKIEKQYLALAYGHIDRPIKFDVGIGKSKTDFRKMTTEDPKLLKPAFTEVFPLEVLPIAKKQVGGKQFDETTLILVKLHTGRTHQIRVHLASIGCPLVGDELYAGKNADLLGLKRQFLHASSLELDLENGHRLHVDSPLPADLRRTLKLLKSVKAKEL